MKMCTLSPVHWNSFSVNWKQTWFPLKLWKDCQMNWVSEISIIIILNHFLLHKYYCNFELVNQHSFENVKWCCVRDFSLKALEQCFIYHFYQKIQCTFIEQISFDFYTLFHVNIYREARKSSQNSWRNGKNQFSSTRIFEVPSQTPDLVSNNPLALCFQYLNSS